MGRPPVGKVAMSDAERHRRYMARLRQRAAKGGAAAPATKPASLDGAAYRAAATINMAKNPDLTADFIRAVIGEKATLKFSDALIRACRKAAMADADPVDTSERDEWDSDV